MTFPSQNSKLVYSFESLSLKPMQGSGVAYLSCLCPYRVPTLMPMLEIEIKKRIKIDKEVERTLHPTIEKEVTYQCFYDHHQTSILI